MTGIVAKILTGLVNAWNVVETDIEADIAKVKSALPSSAAGDLTAVESDVKQAASDALSTTASAAATYAPSLAKTLESAADVALAALLNGYALPLTPLLNGGIDDIVSTGVATLQSWALSAKASATMPVKELSTEPSSSSAGS